MDKFIKPIIPLWKVLFFSLGFYGVQLIIAIFAITTPQFFGNFGVEEGVSIYMWLAVPLVGIFIQPLVGFVGDHIWGAYGRRGFFILLASSFAAVSLLMIAFSQHWMVALFFLFVTLIAINTLIVSYRALVCEMTPPQERVAGYAMLSVLQLLGMLSAIIIKHFIGGDSQVMSGFLANFPSFISVLIVIGAVVLLITAFFGVIFLKEYPNLGYKRYVSYVPFSSETESQLIAKDKVSYIRQSAMWLSVTVLTFLVFISSDFLIITYVIPFVMFSFAVLLLIAHIFNTSKYFLSLNKKRFVELMTDVMNMPLVMKKLNLVLLFFWFATFLFLGNISGIMTQHIHIENFMLSVAPGFETVTMCYIYFIIVALIVTPIVILLTKKDSIGHWLSSAIALLILSFILFYFYQTITMFVVALTALGGSFAVMLTLPYAALSYRLPSKRVGVFFGLFNIFVIVPYILVPSISKSFEGSMFGVHTQTVTLSVSALIFALIFSLMVSREK